MNLRQIYEKLRQQAERNGHDIDEGRLRQQAWMMRDRMIFEQSYSNSTVSSSSAGSGGGGGLRRRQITPESILGLFAQSYIINWVDSVDNIWKIFVFNYDTGFLSESINTELNYNDWELYDNWRHIQEGGFSVVFQNNEDSSYKIFFLNVNGEVQGIKDLDTNEDFQYTENAQGYLGELNSVSTFYHFTNDRVNTHQFPGIDVNDIEIDDASEDDVTKDGSMIVEDKNENKYWIARPNGDLVDITSLLGGESNYRIDYNTDFIFARFFGNSLKAISQEGVLRNEIDLTEFGGLSIDTSTLFGENCAYSSFDISGENLKLMVVYDGDFNRFVTATYSNINDYRTYTERNWINPYSSFGKTVVVSSWNESSSNNIGSITDRVELKWLPKGKEEFYTQILEGNNLVFILGDDDIDYRKTFTHGENPIVMFATESHINVGFLTNDGFVSESTGILAASCSNIFGHNIGEKSFAVFDVGNDRIWQIYGENSIEAEIETGTNWNFGFNDRTSNINGTLVVIDSTNDASASNSFFYTPGSGIESLPVNNGNIYNEKTHGNRTGISSDSQLITKIDESSNLEGFYLLTRLGLSDFVELSLDSNYQIGDVVIGDNIISISFNNSQLESNRVIVYNKSNLQLIHDTEDIQASNIEQYSDRTLVEITDGEETELILIHKDGVKTLSINQTSLSYESNDSYDND